MPRSRFVQPTLKVLPLSEGDSITIREQLTHGEQVAAYARMYVDGPDGLRADRLKSGDALILAYLVDWTLTDHTGAVVPIRGLSRDDLADVISNLDHATALEIKHAIEDHEAAMVAAWEQKKSTSAALSVETSRSLV